MGTLLPAMPLAVSSEGACRIACCGAPGCQAFSFAYAVAASARISSIAPAGELVALSPCFLLSNVTSLMPSNLAASGVLLTSL